LAGPVLGIHCQKWWLFLCILRVTVIHIWLRLECIRILRKCFQDITGISKHLYKNQTAQRCWKRLSWVSEMCESLGRPGCSPGRCWNTYRVPRNRAGEDRLAALSSRTRSPLLVAMRRRIINVQRRWRSAAGKVAVDLASTRYNHRTCTLFSSVHQRATRIGLGEKRFNECKAVFDLTESRFRFIVNPDLDSLANLVWIRGCCRKWPWLTLRYKLQWFIHLRAQNQCDDRPTVPSQPQSIATAHWPVLISSPAEGRRLSWPKRLVTY